MSTSRKTSAAAKKTPATSKPAPATNKVPTKTPVQAIGLDEIKALIALVGREPFQEFEFEAGDMRFRIRKDGPAQAAQAPMAAPLVMAAPAPMVHPVPIVSSLQQLPAVPVDEPGIHY